MLKLAILASATRAISSLSPAATFDLNPQVPLRPIDAAVTWWSSNSCRINASDAASRQTIVVLETGLCQRVPGEAAFPGYRIACGSANGGAAGSIEFCEDTACNKCSLAQSFGSASTCLPNNAAIFGSASFSVRCPAGPAVAQPQPLSLPANAFAITWSSSFCAAATSTSHRTIVIGQKGTCERVPAGAGNG